MIASYHVLLVLPLVDELVVSVVVREDRVCLVLEGRVDPAVVDT